MASLRHQIPIAASPGAVYAALATPSGLRGWWTADSETEDRVGGKATFGFGKRRTVFRMTIAALEPEKRVAWSCHGDETEWEGTTLDWRIAPTVEGSMLRFRHSGWKTYSDYCAMCNATWGELLYRLKDHVEGRKPGPHWRE